VGLIVSQGWTPFIAIIQDHLRMARPQVLGNSKKDQEIAHFVWAAHRAARGTFLSYIATTERATLMEPLLAHSERRYINMVSPSMAQRWLNEIEDAWKAGEFEEYGDDDLYSHLWEQFVEVVVKGEDDWWNTVYEPSRRELVLAGAFDPLPRDREYLAERVENLKALHTPYEAALAKLDEAEVTELNEARP
jgi:hypothetical protein